MEADAANLKVNLIAEHDQEPILDAMVTVKCVHNITSARHNKTSDVKQSGTYLLEEAIPLSGDLVCKVTAAKDGCDLSLKLFHTDYISHCLSLPEMKKMSK